MAVTKGSGKKGTRYIITVSLLTGGGVISDFTFVSHPKPEVSTIIIANSQHPD
jgi:hypothetical protein